MRLTNKQVNELAAGREKILRFAQDLRELADTRDSYFFALCHSAANTLIDGCYEVDRIIMEGSSE